MDNKNWLQSNLWNLVATAVGIAITFSLLNYRVQELEAKFNDYPSAQWFELKFENIDQSLDEIKNCIKDFTGKPVLINSTK